MNKHLLWTLAVGPVYDALGKLTHPHMRKYAERIGADFLVVREMDKRFPHPAWGKLEIYRYLTEYDRLIFMDSDVIVKPDAPNLFDMVPAERFGALNENFMDNQNRPRITREYFRKEGFPLRDDDTHFDRDFVYVNTGLMVVSRAHREMFADPGRYPCNYYEQTYLNGVRWNLEIPLHDLGFRTHFYGFADYNPITGRNNIFGLMDVAPFVHFCGGGGRWKMLSDIREAMMRWGMIKGPVIKRTVIGRK